MAKARFIHPIHITFTCALIVLALGEPRSAKAQEFKIFPESARLGTNSSTSSNLPPQAVDDIVHSPPVSSAPFVVNVLANDLDGNDALTLVSIDQGASGVAEIVDNKISYTPNPGYDGNDTLTYHVRDPEGLTDTAQLILRNSPVVARNTTISADVNGKAEFDLLLNTQDADSDPISLKSVSQPKYGTVVFTATSITYTRTLNPYEPDQFTYTVTDGRGSAATGTMMVSPAKIFTGEC